MNIIEIFWDNVLWHAENKGVTMTDLMDGNVSAAKNKTANITLKKVQEIAELLAIDDYTILFETLDESSH